MVDLFELTEQPVGLLGREADTRVANRDVELDGPVVRSLPRLYLDRDTAGLGELQSIAGQVEQDLTQTRAVDDNLQRDRRLDPPGDLEALGLGARGQEVRQRPRQAP